MRQHLHAAAVAPKQGRAAAAAAAAAAATAGAAAAGAVAAEWQWRQAGLRARGGQRDAPRAVGRYAPGRTCACVTQQALQALRGRRCSACGW